MEIKSTLTNRSGQVLDVLYRESDPLVNLEGKLLQAIHAICFYEDKMVIVYSDEKGYWAPPGGGIEVGESYEQAVVREVMEEANMKVIHQELIGYQDIYEPDKVVRQTRSLCIVEPIDEFVADPGGDVTEIKLIDPEDYKKYFDWGEIGERVMEKAIKMKSLFKQAL